MQKIVVLGAGESGVGAALLAKSKGYGVFLSDNGRIQDNYQQELEHNKIDYEQQRHSVERILNADLVIKSPGIPESVPIVLEIKNKKIPIISEIEFASRFTKGEIIAVTGTNGKTTTVSLIYHVLKKQGCEVALLGNIGKSFAREIIEKQYDYYVLELSSFQLEGLLDFRADVAVILNITPDHLDRYGDSMDAYAKAKFKILNKQKPSDCFIYWEDDLTIQRQITRHLIFSKKRSFSLVSKEVDALLSDSKLIFKEKNSSLNLENQPLSGDHNYMNIMATLLTVESLGFDLEKSFQTLSDFKSVEHRLESVRTLGGVDYVNDSKATNVEALKYALTSFESNIILIAGGIDKGNDYALISDSIKKKVKTLIILGNTNKSLLSFFQDLVSCVQVSNMSEALALAKEKSKAGDVVLLSPACASFDLYRNYEERGQDFKNQVLLLE